MNTYSIEELRIKGPPIAMAMLLACINRGEPFVTYGQIRDALEEKLDVDTIFPTHIGSVAGALMDLILQIDSNAPLINILITRPNGVPGNGVGGYLANRYNTSRYRKWDTIPINKQLEIVASERRHIRDYQHWNEISREIFGTDVSWPAPRATEGDYGGQARSTEAESQEHKNLKLWVAENPACIGLSKKFGHGEIETRLLSGDEVDVMFKHDMAFRAVEVKSIRSGYEDLKRGIYQCVKYREVKAAEVQPADTDVEAYLVTEEPLPQDLLERARLLRVRWKLVRVNFNHPS